MARTSQDREIENQDGPVESVELVKRTDITPRLINKVLEIQLEQLIGRQAQRCGRGCLEKSGPSLTKLDPYKLKRRQEMPGRRGRHST